MGTLSSELKKLGYERTEKESPFEEGATLWTKGFEAVCDETGIVIRDGDDDAFETEYDDPETVYRYYHSEKVKLPGGFSSKYDWGTEGDRFRY
jgi:hypothetical protein